MSVQIEVITEKLTETQVVFTKIINICKKKISNFFTGTVNTGVLENIKCEYYGELHNLYEIATIMKTGKSNELIVKPYDIKLIPKILILIENKKHSNVSCHVSDGYIKVIFAPLTTAAKENLVKQLNKLREEFHIKLRNNRHTFVDYINKQRQEISDDVYKNNKIEIQTSTNDAMKAIDLLFKDKEAKITKV